MLKQLQALLDGSGLLRQLNDLKAEVEGLRLEVHQLTMTLARGVDHLTGVGNVPTPGEDTEAGPPVEISYVDPAFQQEYVDIEQRLTYVTGAPPTEEEILAEWERTREEREGERKSQ